MPQTKLALDTAEGTAKARNLGESWGTCCTHCNIWKVWLREGTCQGRAASFGGVFCVIDVVLHSKAQAAQRLYALALCGLCIHLSSLPQHLCMGQRLPHPKIPARSEHSASCLPPFSMLAFSACPWAASFMLACRMRPCNISKPVSLAWPHKASLPFLNAARSDAAHAATS